MSYFHEAEDEVWDVAGQHNTYARETQAAGFAHDQRYDKPTHEEPLFFDESSDRPAAVYGLSAQTQWQGDHFQDALYMVSGNEYSYMQRDARSAQPAEHQYRPTRNTYEVADASFHGEMVPITALPATYHAVFPNFDRFNAVQSAAFNDFYNKVMMLRSTSYRPADTVRTTTSSCRHRQVQARQCSSSLRFSDCITSQITLGAKFCTWRRQKLCATSALSTGTIVTESSDSSAAS